MKEPVPSYQIGGGSTNLSQIDTQSIYDAKTFMDAILKINSSNF